MPPTTIPPKNYAVLVLNTNEKVDGSRNEPVLFDNNGQEISGLKFELDKYSEAHGSCLAIYRGVAYLFGGVQQKRQISRLNGCQFDRIGSIQFDFTYGSCGLFFEEFTDFILLCFV